MPDAQSHDRPQDASTVVNAADRDGLRIERLSKTFPATRALIGVSLHARRGEVLALLGHNGSGKSTLIKVLSGFHQPDPGFAATVDGHALELGDAIAATASGLRFVHQDLGLIRELNAVDNVALTVGYTRRGRRIDQSQQVERTVRLLGRFGVHLDVTRPLTDASPVELSCIAIARSLWDWEDGPRVLILDEPTAALPEREVERLLSVVREVKSQGHVVVYVSHRMDEVMSIADRAMVLREGRVVCPETPAAELSRDQLAELIAGHELERSQVVRHQQRGPHTVVEIRGLRGREVKGVDLLIGKGEVIGVAGLAGSGRDELPYLVAGARPSVSEGPWHVDGQDVPAPDAAGAARLGIRFVPPQRDREGLIAEFSVRENLTLAALPQLARRRVVSMRVERAEARRWLTTAGISQDVLDWPITQLSGGNRQRVLLARYLNTEPVLLVLSEPTAGVDVAARQALYDLLRERAKAGLAILLASSDAEDLVSLADRILVMRRGVAGAPFDAEGITAAGLITALEAEEVNV